MRRYRIEWMLFAASMMAFGCEGASKTGTTSSAPATTAQAAAAPESVPAAREHGRFRHHGGVAAGLFRAAHHLELTQAAEDSLGALEANLKAADDNVHGVMKAFRADVVAGVQAGALDQAKLGADTGVIDQAVAAHKSKEADALSSLHGLLDASERTSLVAAVRAKQAEHEARMTERMTAREANGALPDRTQKRLDALTTQLGLDAGQKTQVAAVLAKLGDPPNAAGFQSRWQERKARVDAVLSAFAGDAFDATQLDLNLFAGKTAREPVQHMVAFVSQVLPILHADQRDRFAATLNRPSFPFHEPTDTPPDEQAH